MTKPSSMTELEAVNVLLTTIGEAPVNTLSGNQVTDVTIAKQVLNEVSREVQSQGWHFNTEPKVKLSRNLDNEIAVPADTARIDSNEYNVVIREGKLFDLDERKFTFDSNIEADIVFYRDFEVLPDTAKKYITTRAARIYSDRMINSETMHRMLAKDEQSALIDLKEYEGDTGDYNMMDSYSVARVLNRGHKRILM
ncbi:tail tubular protein A [Roseobacter phage CRP-125]|uniref:Tail tubular protein A n=1 Tax=Roseobacter phage CRP-125 TaxID=3072844 RepID=A0AAX3ZVZ0_9CAUD|nr:tail tubular protein A [Roseobacter phage CRP-125]